MRLLVAVVLFALFAALAPAAHAADPFADAEPLSADELAARRGAFMHVGGVTFAFAIVTRTFLDGKPLLTTRFDVTGVGAPTRRIETDESVTANVDDGGFRLSNAAGTLSIVQRFDQKGVVNVLASSFSDVTLSQETSIIVFLPGFADTQALMREDLTFLNLSRALETRHLLK